MSAIRSHGPRNQRIDARRAPRRDVAGDDAATAPRSAEVTAKVSGSRTLTFGQQVRREIGDVRASAAPRPSASPSGDEQRGRGPSTSRSTDPRLRAERHPHADLARALRDRVVRDAVEADRGQQQRERAERRQHDHVIAERRQRLGDLILERPDVEHRRASDRVCCTSRRTAGGERRGVCRRRARAARPPGCSSAAAADR